MIFWTYALILAGLAMLGPFTTDTYFPFFPDLQRYFGIQAASLQQSLSLYLLSFSIMICFTAVCPMRLDVAVSFCGLWPGLY